MRNNMNCIQRGACVGALLVAALVGLQLRAGSAQAAPPHACSWSVISSPNVWFDYNHLDGVAAISANDVWSVGYDSPDGGSNTTITEHWNGSQWSVVNSPNPGQDGSSLFGVAAVATNDVWAVGYNFNFNASKTTLIEHWDGTSWSVVSSPDQGSLGGVAVVSANDIWAVGSNSSLQTVVEHWNGTSWSNVPGPVQGGLSSVTAISTNNVWAVGGNGSGKTLIAHWNGKKWKVVSSPNAGSGSNSLYGVAASSARDIWAVGYYNNNQTLIEHWNGTRWSVVRTPGSGVLTGITAHSPTNIWAVGYGTNGTLTMHWNGSQWSVVPSPNPGQLNILSGVTQIPNTSNVWAVGSYVDNNSSEATLTELLSC